MKFKKPLPTKRRRASRRSVEQLRRELSEVRNVLWAGEAERRPWRAFEDGRDPPPRYLFKLAERKIDEKIVLRGPAVVQLYPSVDQSKPQPTTETKYGVAGEDDE